MPKKKVFVTTFGEMMSQLGVQKTDLLPTPKPAPQRNKQQKKRSMDQVRPLTDPRDARQGPDATHRAEVRQFLDTIHGLQQQRSQLRGTLQERDQQVEAFIEELATARQKMRNMEALRRSDMAQITRLRQALESMTDRCTTATKERDTLRRRAEQRPAPPPKPSPTLKDSEASELRRAAFKVAAACRDIGISRLVIVGGSPPYHSQLRALFGDALSLRLVLGDARRTSKQALSDIAWADVVVIWGGTILSHSTSQLYKGESILTIAHRGLAGMLRALAAELG